MRRVGLMTRTTAIAGTRYHTSIIFTILRAASTQSHLRQFVLKRVTFS
jgi:hypothetical protein